MAEYSLTEAVLRARTADALQSHPSSGRFVALAIRNDTPLADVARTTERQVFERSFGNDGDVMAAEYGPYEQSSLFLLVLDRETGLPAGAGRVIEGGGKTLDDAPELIGTDLSDIVAAHDMYEGKIWDFATVGVLPVYEGDQTGVTVSSLLYRTFINAGRRAEVRHIVLMLDKRAKRGLTLLGAPFEPLAGSEPFAYLGSSETYAMYVSFPDLAPSIAEQGVRLANSSPRHQRAAQTRRIASRVSTQVGTGSGLDEHVDMPALERRRFRRPR